jgi:hypothetical protein
VALTREDHSENCFILIGLGGRIDLSKEFDLTTEKVHVIDSSRPFHLENLRHPELHVWGINEVEEDIASFFRYQQSAASAGRKRNRDTENDGGEEEGDSEVDWRVPSNVSTEMEKEYYSTRSCGQSESQLIARLASDLRSHEFLHFWCGAIGITDLYLRYLIDVNRYTAELRVLIEALNLVRSHRHESGPNPTALRDRGVNDATSYTDGELIETVERRPFLLRHWTLWSAIWHEPVLASKLNTHQSQVGEANLRTILAKAGVAYTEANLHWSTLTQDRRSDILYKLSPLLGELIGTEHPLSLPVLCRKEGFSVEASSFDICRLFYAEATMPFQPKFGALTSAVVGKSPASPSNGSTEMDSRDFSRTQFWKAFDLILCNPSSKEFSAAVATFVKMRTAVSEASSAVLGKVGGVIAMKTFNHTLLSDLLKRDLADPFRQCAFAEHVSLAHLEMTKKQTAGEKEKSKSRSGMSLKPMIIRSLHGTTSAAGPTAGFSPQNAVYDTVLFIPKVTSLWGSMPIIDAFLGTVEEFNRTESVVVDGKTELAVVGNNVNPFVISVKGLESSQRFVETLHLKLYRRR